MPLDILQEHAVRAIFKGGGVPVGFMERLCLFNSPQTGTTLALDIADVLKRDGYRLVAWEIACSNHQFKVAAEHAKLTRLLWRLSELLSKTDEG